MKTKSIFLLVLIFGVFIGWNFGINSAKTTWIAKEAGRSQITRLDQIVSETTINIATIRLLKSGSIDDAKHMLLLRRDGNILVINELLNFSDLESKNRATNLFHMIAEQNSTDLYQYAGSLAKSDVNAILAVSNILANYK